MCAAGVTVQCVSLSAESGVCQSVCVCVRVKYICWRGGGGGGGGQKDIKTMIVPPQRVVQHRKGDNFSHVSCARRYYQPLTATTGRRESQTEEPLGLVATLVSVLPVPVWVWTQQPERGGIV